MEKEEFQISKNNFKFYIKALLALEKSFIKYQHKFKTEESITIKETGYLIDKKFFDDLKEKLYYTEFKTCLSNDTEFEKNMKEKYGNGKYISYIPLEQKIFNSSKELEDSIQLNCEYIIISKLIWKLMNNGRYKKDEGKIIYEINNEQLIITFSAEDKIYFKYNLNIINNKNLLINNFGNVFQQNNIKNNNKEIAIKKMNSKLYDSYIKLLLNIYSNYRYLNQKLAQPFEKDPKFEICYIVNKNYINEIKKYFNYNEFCENKLIEKYTQNENKNFLFNELLNNDEFIEELKTHLSQTDFFDLIKINKVKIKEMKDNNKLTNINKIYLNNKELFYYTNFEIISKSLYEYLDQQNISLKDEYMIKTKCLFGENKLFFYPNLSKNNSIIISNINANYELITEHILCYNNSIDLIKHIEEVIYNGYENTISDLIFETNEALVFLESSKTPIGKAYKIKDEKISKEIEMEIFNIIKLYLFNLDLKKNLLISMDHSDSDNYENYIKVDKCYLVNKEFILQYRKYYLYDELYNYLEKEEIKKKLQIQDKYKSSYNEVNIKLIYEDIKENANFFKKYCNIEIKVFDEKLIDIDEIILIYENNKEIKYYVEFALINSDLEQSLNKKYNKNISENEYIINMGKIIILNSCKIYQILIGTLDIMNNLCTIVPLAIINFDNEDGLYFHYEILKSIDFQTYIKQIKKDNNKLYDQYHNNEIGEFYSLSEYNKEINDKKNQNDIVKKIIELYFNLNNFDFNIRDANKTISSQEKYYLINKEWINYLKKCYDYEQIIQIINKNEEFSFDSQIINEKLQLIPKEIIDDINIKEKTYDKNSWKPFEKYLTVKNKEVYYYDECILINKEIKNILDNNFNNEIKDDFNILVNCFIDSNKRIFLLYELKKKYIISVGKLEENDILEIKIIISLSSNEYYKYYFNKIIINNEIPNFIDMLKQDTNNIKIMKSKNQNIGVIFLPENIKKNEKDFEKQIYNGKNLIKLFIVLFLFYEELNENINKEIKNNNSETYFLINKEFMKKYKEYYSYNAIVNTIQTNENIKTFFLLNKDNILLSIKNKLSYDSIISNIIKQFKEGFILELGRKMDNQIDLIKNLANDNEIKIIKKRKIFKYYEENEIVNSEFIDLFCRTENKEIYNLLNTQEINCYLGEKMIFINLHNIKNNYYYLDVGHLENNILINDIIIYYNNKSKLDEIISQIKKESFKKYINPHLNNIIEKNISSILNDEGNIIGKIIKINDLPKNLIDNIYSGNEFKFQNLNADSKKIVKLILYMKNLINSPSLINKSEMQSGYFIKYEFLLELQNVKNYQLIWNYIFNNTNIQQIINDTKIEDPNELYYKVINEFDEKIIIKSNINNNINIFANSYHADFIRIKLNDNNYAYIASNCLLLNKEIFNLFSNKSDNDQKIQFKFFQEKDRVFILIDQFKNTKTIEVYKINSENKLEVELILDFFNLEDREDNFRQIKILGFTQYLNIFSLDLEDIVSPIYDINENQIGNIYKYDSSYKDYTKYNINLGIRKIFLLYLNEKILKNSFFKSNNNIYEYYLVNKIYMRIYKNHYNYSFISSSIDNNTNIQSIMNRELKKTENNNKIKISDKMLDLMTKNLDKNIIKDFNIKDKESILFKGEKKIPDFIRFGYGNINFFYFHYFELINSETYNFLSKETNKNIDLPASDNILKDSNENKAEKVECYFDKIHIVIKFLNANPDGKYMLQIGKLNFENTFEPEYFLLYDDINFLLEHTINIMNNKGFDDYCGTLKSSKENIIDVKSKDNKIIGIAIKKNISEINLKSDKNELNQLNQLNIFIISLKIKTMNI